MSNRTNAQLSALATIVSELRKRTPQALAHAHNIVADGYPTLGGSGGGHGGKNTISDPTANAALNRTTGTGSGYRVADQVQLLEHSLRSIEVECLPKDLPELVRVDVSHLELGQALHVSDLPVLPGVKYLADSDVTVFLVSEPKIADEAVPTEGGPTEPEVINEKKTEEGAAAPAKG